MDLTLGGPVLVPPEDQSKCVEHRGSCNDSEFGCTKCHNTTNGGAGKISVCDWCNTRTYTQITLDLDTPSLIPICEECGKKMQKLANEELAMLRAREEEMDPATRSEIDFIFKGLI